MKNLTNLNNNKILYYFIFLITLLYSIFIFAEYRIFYKWSIYNKKTILEENVLGSIIWKIDNKFKSSYIFRDNSGVKYYLISDKNLSVGDKVSIKVKVRNIIISNVYDYYLYSNYNIFKYGNIIETIFIENNEHISIRLFNLLLENIHKVRKTLINLVDSNLSATSRNIISKLSVGYEIEDIEDIDKYFRDAGVSHVLVVSGLHIGFVYMLVDFIFKILPISPVLRSICSLFFVLIFVFLTGCSIPVIRAAVFIICLVLNNLLERKSSPLHILFLTALLILIFNPQSLFSVSFQLSFFACFGILYFYPALFSLIKEYISHFNIIIQNLIKLFLVTLSAQIMVIPVISYYFGKISIIGFFSNIVIVSLTPILLWGSFLGYFLYFVFSDLTKIYWEIFDFITIFYSKVVKFFALLPYSNIDTVRTNGFKILLYYLFVISILWFLKTKKYRVLIFYSIIFVVVFRYNFDNKFRLTFFDVGLGDSIFIKTEDRQKFLIDTSENYEIASKKIIPYLKNYTNSLDFLIITHPHYPHYGAAEYILENINVKNVIIPDCPSEDFSYTKLIDKVKMSNINLIILKDNCSKEIIFKNGKIEIFKTSPDNKCINEEFADNNSLLVRLVYNSKNIFLCNDVKTHSIINYIKKSGIKVIYIFQIPNHGKNYEIIKTLADCFLKDNVKIKFAIISTDKTDIVHNSFRFPILSTHNFSDIEIFLDKNKKSISFYGYKTILKM
ncbi:MAG: ComEC/Rec2 family competence protein [Endomicrobia bacterium]|nr:ComEC/Rec2 family competence protein [Endomicrobiia bacterium]